MKELPKEKRPKMSDAERLRGGKSIALSVENLRALAREIAMYPHRQVKFIREGETIWLGVLGKVHDEIATELKLEDPVDAGLLQATLFGMTPQMELLFHNASQSLRLPTNPKERATTIALARNLSGSGDQVEFSIPDNSDTIDSHE